MSGSRGSASVRKKNAAKARAKKPSAVEQQLQKLFGLTPGLKRGNILPFAVNPKTGKPELGAPQFVYDMARAFAVPGVAASGQPIDAESEATNFAANFTGTGGVASRMGRGAVGEGRAVLGMSGAPKAAKPPSLLSAVRAKGKVYTGPTHLDALRAIPDPKVRAEATFDANSRGFVNERGRFLDRYKAADYARNFDLFSPDAPDWAKTASEVISENLKLPDVAVKEAPSLAVTPKFERPSVSPIATQAGERGLPLRGRAQTEAQHPSKFGVFSSYKTPTPVEETKVVAEPYAVLPRDRMFDMNRLEGAKVVSLYGDRERAGDTILSVNDHPTNVDTQGGAMFPALQEALGSEGAWGSEYGALKPIRRAVEEGLDAGQRVFGVTTAMGPGALNQTIDMTDLLHQMAATSPIRKRDLSVFDKQARDVLPGYAGLLHDEAAQQLHGMTQGQRKAFVALLDNANALKQGFPNVPAARYALTDQNLVDVPAGTSGYSFVELGPKSLEPLEGGVSHRTYPDRMQGTYEGRGPLVPFTTMFSDFAKNRRAANALAGSDLRAFELGKPSQDMTPEAFDLLMKYLQQVDEPY